MGISFDKLLARGIANSYCEKGKTLSLNDENHRVIIMIYSHTKVRVLIRGFLESYINLSPGVWSAYLMSKIVNGSKVESVEYSRVR